MKAVSSHRHSKGSGGGLAGLCAAITTTIRLTPLATWGADTVRLLAWDVA